MKTHNLLIKNNIIKFKKKKKIIINLNNIDLLKILKNQTNSNFNNKYNLLYKKDNMKKKLKIRKCFNLIQKGVNLNEINKILNGPKEITSYKIQTEPNQNENFWKINERFNMKFNRIKNGIQSAKKVTISVLGNNIIPFISQTNSILCNRNLSGF